ncbi:hypothetical protein GY45DRAFT_847643 [Cubamyces sp. BRFM 1775]|nr:hypothetical protein GY45DRAFT_847643 [Cubamyces sp. BRFM 1775]
MCRLSTFHSAHPGALSRRPDPHPTHRPSMDRSRRHVARSRSHPTTLARTTFPPYHIPQYLHAVRTTLCLTLYPARPRSHHSSRALHNPYQSVLPQNHRSYQHAYGPQQGSPRLPNPQYPSRCLPVTGLRCPELPFTPSSAPLPSP